jgi:DNA repair photolyase
MKAEDRHKFLDAEPRKDILRNLERDLDKQNVKGKTVFFSFTSDPYQAIEKDLNVTGRAIKMVSDRGAGIRVLTKSSLVLRDIELLCKIDAEVGTTLLFSKDATREKWEPNADTVQNRMDMIKKLHGAGIKTWVSVEPVIDPEQALDVMFALDEFVDTWKIGKLNHHKDIELHVNQTYGWGRFLRDALTLVGNGRYYIKDDLWKYADKKTRLEWAKSRN